MQKDDFDVVITQLLGRVSSADPFVHCVGNPQGNSSRWVFDVQQRIDRKEDFSFQLKSWVQNREVSASILSFSLTPLSASYWRAPPFIAHPFLPNIQITAKQNLSDPLHLSVMSDPIMYRIAIDLVHSTSR